MHFGDISSLWGYFKLSSSHLHIFTLWTYGVVVSMFNFHRSDRGSNPGRGGKIS